MRFAFIALILLALATCVIASDCISCEEMSGKPQARILTINDDTAHTLDIYAYYEDLEATPSRQPINDSIIIIEMTNSTGLKELYKTYTDANGSAHFDFTARKNGCITFKVLYCPFCSPSSPECGFKACLNYSLIETDKNSADEIDVGPGSKPAPALLNEERYLPTVDQLSYCPPPPAMGGTPGLCLPLLIVFSLLSGALYLTGKNPWAGFNIGGARVGKHMRYQARGRGFSLDLKSAIMSISSAAGEMKDEVNDKGEKTGRKQGEATPPKWFLVSNIKDLGTTITGGVIGGSGTQTSAGGQTVGGGGGGKRVVGIVGAFKQAGRDGRASTARALGARTDKDGKVESAGAKGPLTGRAFGFGDVMKSWGTEFGLALGRIGATLFDASFLGSAVNIFTKTNFSLSGTLDSAIRGSVRETTARAIADAERHTDNYGTMCSDPNLGVRFAEGRSTVDDDGSVTGRRGARYIEVGGAPEGSRAVATVENIGLNGESTITIHVSSGSEDSKQLTNWRIENGHAVGFERVMSPGSVEQVGVVYRLGPDNTVVAAGINSYSGVTGQPTTMDVHRDSQGRISEVGTIVIQRNDQGAITGMSDRGLPTGQPGQAGMQVGEGSPMGNAVRELIHNDGQNLSAMQGIQAMSAQNLREMTSRTMETANASLERTQRIYMEQYGLVDVTDKNVLRLDNDTNPDGTPKRNRDGTPVTDTRMDATIRVVDASYTPTGEPATRTGLQNGTTITVQNDAYTAATDAGGRNILQRDQPVTQGDHTVYQTSLVGTNLVLDTNVSRGTPPDASGVREHVNGFVESYTNMTQSYQAYQSAVMTDVGAQLRERNPALLTALQEGGAARSESAAALEGRLTESGVSGDVAHAAGLLLGSTSFGQTEVGYSADARRGATEYHTAYSVAVRDNNREGMEPGSMTPRAQAYYEAREGVRAQYEQSGATFNPEDPGVVRQIEVAMRPRIEAIDTAERRAITNARSDDPATRAQGEAAITVLHILPPNVTPPAGSTLADAATEAYLGHSTSGTRDVVDSRLHDNVGATMAAHPEFIAHGESPVGTRVAGYMLGLGTDLAGMSDTAVIASVGSRIQADPSITDKPAAMEFARTHLDEARGVARSFDDAEHIVAREVTSNPTTYMPFDSDRAYRGVMVNEPYVPRPVDSPEARNLAQAAGVNLDDPTARTEFEKSWRQTEETHAAQVRVAFVADTSRDWAAAQDNARHSLPYDASDTDRTNYALAQFAAGQAGTYGTPGAPNPIGLDAHSGYLATLAAGAADSNSRGYMHLGSGSGDISSPDYTPQGPDPSKPINPNVPTLDGRSFIGYVAGTRSMLLASQAYGADVPPEVYTSGTEALRHFNRSEYTQAADGFLASSQRAQQYCEERARQDAEQAGGNP